MFVCLFCLFVLGWVGYFCKNVMKISRCSSWNMSFQVRIAVAQKFIKKNKKNKLKILILVILLFTSDRGFIKFAQGLKGGGKMYIKYTQFRQILFFN